MMNENATQLLEKANLRLTRTRKAIACLLFADGHDKHVTAEWVARELEHSDEKIALATVYNTLNSFVDAGLLRQIQTGGNVVVFDTNVAEHSHFMRESTGELIDIPVEDVVFSHLPEAPEGMTISGWDLIIRVK